MLLKDYNSIKFTSILDGVEWWTSSPGRITPLDCTAVPIL